MTIKTNSPGKATNPATSLISESPDSLGDTMTKSKTWLDLALSLDSDWPPRQPVTLTELVAEARAIDWDFTNWC